MNRYSDLVDLVRDLKPDHVVEIGTWNGQRAAEFMGVSNCYYTGFDLFEEATKETDEHEFNVKQHFEIVAVSQMLEERGFTKFMLVRGNTNETLEKTKIRPFDFCFIDGGHSKDTIDNDFQWAIDNINPGGIIVLDDYYIPEKPGMGCNHVFHSVESELFGPKDNVAGGGSVQLLKVQA